ncbi:GtrA family protein [Candidatus Parcubacteria bacterium]|nr:MAG: GtrA family protein [Candidatus Parcubacteria bacterium]
MASRKDLGLALIIGAAVGLLSQAILANFAREVHEIIPVPYGVVQAGIFFGFLVLAPVALSVAGWIGKRIPVVYQLAKFAAVGSLNSFVDLGVFNLETLMLGGVPGVALFSIFKGVSFLAATTNSYFWNKHWTFGAAGQANAGEVVKFYAVAIAGGIVNVGVATAVKAAADAAGFSENFWGNIASPIAGIFAALVWNFLGYKFFVFKNTTAPAS